MPGQIRPLTLAAACALAIACGSNSRNPVAPAADFSGGEPAVSAAKVEVCHYSEESMTFKLLSIGAPALDAHLAHGDGLPGGPVPSTPGMKFDANCAAVAIAPVLDQSNITYLTFGGAGAPGSSVTAFQYVAQTFTVGISGTLAKVDLGLYRDPAAISGDVTLDIVPFSAFPGYDLSSSLFSTTLPIASIPLLTLDLTTVDVSSANISVTAGDKFAIVLRRASGPSWVVWQDSDFSAPYGGGDFYTWHPGEAVWRWVSGDHRFQTWVIQ